jgi:hypothetical protein
MDSVMKSLDAQLKELPRHFLEKIILRKLKAAGIEDAQPAAAKLATNVMAGKHEKVKFGNSKEKRDVVVELGPADLAEIETKVQNFIAVDFPKVLESTAEYSGKRLAESLKKKWPEQAEWQYAVTANFMSNLDLRWGPSIDYLKMLLTISRERQEERLKRLARRKKLPDPARQEVLLRLQARGCQVAEEIIVLLENGFADGAMARWRTLHEIEVVSSIINAGGEDMAIRYIDHQVVEDKNSLDDYERRQIPNGGPPVNPREKMLVLKEYDALIAKYGKPFSSPCGWAADYVNKAKVIFGDLEEAAQQIKARPYYRMASHNVHANPSGTFSRLGALDDRIAISGRSNAGLGDPGIKTAHSLVLLTLSLYGPKFEIMDIVALKTVGILGDEAVASFKKAHRRLARDDKKAQRAMEELARNRKKPR